MAKSQAFIQIKEGFLEITAKIPLGRVTTYSAIGEHMNAMSRHVAYILATLTVEEREELPWYRVVANKGAIAAGKINSRHQVQIEKLTQEGVKLTAKNYIENFEELYCPPNQLVSWDYSTKRYLGEIL